MIFRQLFDRVSCTYTYLLGDPESGQAVLIDPVAELVDRDLGLVGELGLTLAATLETHVHADHVTGAWLLKQRTGCDILYPAGPDTGADRTLAHGDRVEIGAIRLEVRHTPGHTGSSVTYVAEGMAFTGDTLLIRGCGRTDFQEGDAATLYRSVHEQIFTLPDATRLYPGHDYKGRTVTTVAEEKAHNPRLGGGRTVEEFSEIMANLGLAPPAKIHIAVPANLRLGRPDSGWDTLERGDVGALQVSVDWLQEHLKDVRVVDVRGPNEFRGDLGQVPGAKLVPYILLGPSTASWERSLPIVTVCRRGDRADRAALELERAGFERVAFLEGGMLAWRGADEGDA